MRISFFILTGLLIVSFSSRSFAESQLIYDTKTYCQRIASFSDKDKAETIKTCMEEEESARIELAKISVDTDVLRYCLKMIDDIKASTSAGSYTLLKTCLDSEVDAKKRYQ